MREFRAEILDILRRRFPETPAEPGDAEDTIRFASGMLHLGNLFAIVQHLPPEERDDAITDFLLRTVANVTAPAAAKAPPASWAAARMVLRPRLCTADYLQAVPGLIHSEFARDVMVAYVIDEGPQVRFINERFFNPWGVSVNALNDAAIANLEALSRDIAIEPEQPASGSGGYVVIATGDSYDATRLLLPEFRARVLSPLGDVAFAGIPNRDFFVVWSRGFGHHADFIAQMAADAHNRPYPLTDTIFVITKDGVRPATAAERRGADHAHGHSG